MGDVRKYALSYCTSKKYILERDLSPKKFVAEFLYGDMEQVLTCVCAFLRTRGERVIGMYPQDEYGDLDLYLYTEPVVNGPVKRVKGCKRQVSCAQATHGKRMDVGPDGLCGGFQARVSTR